MPDSQTSSSAPRLALVGFGEAGKTFADAAGWGKECRGWDLLEHRRDMMPASGITQAATAGEALAGAEVVLSLVTADSALRAAQDYASLLPESALWCDMNSVAPGTKREAAAAIEGAGAAYVDVAVMAPVDKGLAVPLLLSGSQAERAKDMLARLGFTNLRVVGEEVGRASAIKMIRSVVVKGIEALTWECAAAAEQAGVFDEVMASLDASERDWDWARKVAYNRERMETHGERRAAEMEEVAATLRELGVEPVMSEGTVRRQREAAAGNREKRNESE
jgi:3-hydroxyisobutyrate dehydrogenase-like beta-hydroxyacid dehydrogenase